MRTMPPPDRPMCAAHRQVLAEAREGANAAAARLPDEHTHAQWFVAEVECCRRWYWYAAAPVTPDLTGLGRMISADEGWAPSRAAANRRAAAAAHVLCGGDLWLRRLDVLIVAGIMLAVLFAAFTVMLAVVDFAALPRLIDTWLGLIAVNSAVMVAHYVRWRHLRSTRH